jgi:hypothetical protein
MPPQMIVSGKELRELIEDAMKIRDERVHGEYNVIETKLDGISQRLDKVNGTIAKHEKIINERAIVVADYLNHAKEQATESEEITKRIRTLEDNQLSNNAIKKWIIGAVSVTGGVIVILFTLYQLFTGKI